MLSTPAVSGEKERHTYQPGDRPPYQKHVPVPQGGAQENYAGDGEQAPADQIEAAAQGQSSPVSRLNSAMSSSTGSARAWMPVQ